MTNHLLKCVLYMKQINCEMISKMFIHNRVDSESVAQKVISPAAKRTKINDKTLIPAKI